MEASANRAAILERRAAGWLGLLGRRLWLALSAAWAAITGLLPHVLHHAGPLAGAALFAGVGGSLLFGALGLLVAIPFLHRMHRRFRTWRAPVIAVAVFAGVFSISTFVVGPRIGGGERSSTPESAAPSAIPTGVSEEEHGRHH